MAFLAAATQYVIATLWQIHVSAYLSASNVFRTSAFRDDPETKKYGLWMHRIPVFYAGPLSFPQRTGQFSYGAFNLKDRSKLCSMAVVVEMHNTGNPEARAEVVAMIEHVRSDRLGDWRVSIIGSQANDRWEMKITGPNAFERSYTLEGAAREHEATVIGQIVSRMVPGRKG